MVKKVCFFFAALWFAITGFFLAHHALGIAAFTACMGAGNIWAYFQFGGNHGNGSHTGR